MVLNQTTLKNEIACLETELMERQKRLRDLRRQLPPQEVPDYVLKGPSGKKVKLSEMFDDKDDLIVIHTMGSSCSYCTMWADGFNGVLQHLESRAEFVVVSPDSPERQATFAQKRGWRFQMYSSEGSKFTEDMGFKNEDGWLPGVSTFYRKTNGGIARISKADLGPGDPFCAVWHLFDLLAEGPNNWEPALKY
ncbi:MAG: DUF899 family protein [Candidatus Poribacteria bacterium]|nr:DUF899 family protein [Candidatus Poribacteria bacterium]